MRRRSSDPVQATIQSPPAPSSGSAVAPEGNGLADGTEIAASGIAIMPTGVAVSTGSAAQRRRKRDRRDGGTVLAIIPRDLDEVYRVAKAVLNARLAPASYTQERGAKLSDEEVIARLAVGIMKGSELGFPPITALSTIAIIDKKPCLFGDGASALIQSRGHLDSMTIEEIGTIPGAAVPTAKFADDFGVRITMRRRGQREPYIGQFTVGDAKRARLWMDPHREPWIKYPKRQLKWRAFAWPARDGFSDDLMGLGIAEEMLDVPPELPTKTDLSFLDDGLPTAVPTSISISNV